MLVKENGEVESRNQPNAAGQAIQDVEGRPGKKVERVAREQGNGGGYNLPDQFGGGVEAAEIIIKTDHTHLQGNQEKRETGRQARGETEGREEKTQDEGNAP